MNEGVMLELTLVSSDVVVEYPFVSVGVEVANVLTENGTVVPYRTPYMPAALRVVMS